jgi:hypothetical protein
MDDYLKAFLLIGGLILGGFLLYAMFPNWDDGGASERAKLPTCPHCLGKVNVGASKCVNCGSDIAQ